MGTGYVEGFIAKAKADQEVLAVILFGSYARGEERSGSDLDICLVLKLADYSNLDLSRKKLAYLKSFNLDVQVYQQLPLYIRRRVLKEGEILFCRDEEALYELAFHTIREFEDFKHIYYAYLAEVAHV